MRLVQFSVSNYRSITTAHRLPISSSTVLVGPNNEGKSNLLAALVIAMTVVQRLRHSVLIGGRLHYPGRASDYDWERDFPVSLQASKPAGESTFRLEFELTYGEILEFRDEVQSNLNGTLPIEIRIGRHDPVFKVVKKGPGGPALSRKASAIGEFVSNRIDVRYIPAVRTAKAAMKVVSDMLDRQLADIERQESYQQGLALIAKAQQPVLERISAEVTTALKAFLPKVRKVDVRILDAERARALLRSFEIIIDDGTATKLEHKGDGVQSLVALSLLRGGEQSTKARVLALEEPESHLHPNAIHQLRTVIQELSQTHQVVLTTHCPLFVDRTAIGTNILVTDGRATPAKTLREVREILGVRASDNLIHAQLVLVVEGEEDRASLHALMSHQSASLRNYLRSHTLVIEPLGGVGRLMYKLSDLRSAVCAAHVFVDADDPANEVVDNAQQEALLEVAETHQCICQGMKEAEFEDMIDVDLYSGEFADVFGVSLSKATFRTSRKWSDRMRETFRDQGKQWTRPVASRAKRLVSDLIVKRPGEALNDRKRSAFDSLVTALEERLHRSP